MVTPHPVELYANVTVDGLPMTPEVFQRLETAVERLADSLPATAVQALVDGASEELGSPAVPAAWEFHLGAQRLDTLRRVLAQARVIQPNGTVIVGSRVVIRDEDGELDTYSIVAPSEANTRAGSISPDSPLGKAILGRRVGETAEVVAPGGARWVTVEQVE
jgi:transcription elongation factor GreA